MEATWKPIQFFRYSTDLCLITDRVTVQLGKYNLLTERWEDQNGNDLTPVLGIILYFMEVPKIPQQ